MRIVCHSVEHFAENLRVGEVFQKIVWVDAFRKEGNEHKTLLFLRASAVVRFGDGEFLLQYGEQCGVDFTDDEPCMEGTEEVNRRKGHLVEVCRDMGLTVKPGAVEL